MLRPLVFASAFLGVFASAHATDYQCYCKFSDTTYLVSPAAKDGAIYAKDNKGTTRFYGNISGDVTYDYTNASEKKSFD